MDTNQNAAQLTTSVQPAPILPEYAAEVRKLRLPGQDALKNAPEHCSADPVMLETIGRSVGQQVRIKRKNDSRFVALYTVKQANPAADLRDAGRAHVIRCGQRGRNRLGTSAEIRAIVEARVVDAAPQPRDAAPQPRGRKAVRFFELAEDNGKQSYFIAIAPHGGMIEKHTDEQATETVRQLIVSNFEASWWLCKGYGDAAKGASDRWHITSTDLHPACFPLLQSVMSRRFCYAVAFHGFDRRRGEADVYIGGAALQPLKVAIQRAVNGLRFPIRVKISDTHDSPKFQGFSADNITNRIATAGIHLEQSAHARKYHLEIAGAVAQVFAFQLRFLVCGLAQATETERIRRKAEFVEALGKSLAEAPLMLERALEDYRVWKATDEALGARIKIVEKIEETFAEATVKDLRCT